MKMKFIKGIVIGTALTAGVAFMYKEGMMNKKKVMRQGRKMAKRIGIM